MNNLSILKKSLIKLIIHGKEDISQPFLSSLLRIEDDLDIIKLIMKNIDKNNIENAILNKLKNSCDIDLKYFIWEIILEKNNDLYKELLAIYEKVSIKEKIYIIDVLHICIEIAEVNKFIYKELNNNKNNDIIAVSIKTLSYWKNNNKIESIILQFKDSTNDNIIKEIINGLERIGKSELIIKLLYLDNISDQNKLFMMNHIKNSKELSTIPTLIKMLDNPNIIIKVGVIRALGFAEPKIIDELLKHIEHFSIFYHSAFVETFSQIALNYQEDFFKLLKNKFSKKSMEFAVECLEKHSDKDITKKVTQALKTETNKSIETSKALLAIDKLNEIEKKFIEALLNENDETIRSNAVMKLEKRTNYENISISMDTNSTVILLQTILSLPKIDTELKNIVIRFLYHPDKRICSAVMDFIIKFRIFESESYLKYILENSDVSTVKSALNVIGKINMRTFIADLRDKFIVSSNKTIIIQTINTFADMRLERTVEILLELIDNPKYKEYEKNILKALSNIKHDSLIEIFKDLYKKTTNIDEKIILMRGLFKNGGEDNLADIIDFIGDKKYLSKVLSIVVEFKNIKLIKEFIMKYNEVDLATQKVISSSIEKLKPANLFTQDIIDIYKTTFMK